MQEAKEKERERERKAKAIASTAKKKKKKKSPNLSTARPAILRVSTRPGLVEKRGHKGEEEETRVETRRRRQMDQ